MARLGSLQLDEAEKAEFNQFSEFLMQQIGTPPNLEKAQEINEKFNLSIYITGPDLAWGKNPSFDDHLQRQIKHNLKDYSFTFTRKKKPFQYDPWKTLGLFIFAIPILIFISNILVSRILQPLKTLVLGTQRIARGDFDLKLETQSSDELGMLTESFNFMSQKINEQINDMQTLLLGIAHEFKTPLTRIKLILENGLDENLKRKINHELNLINDIADNILEQHRLGTSPERLNLTPIDLNVFVSNFATENQIELIAPNDTILADIDTERMKLVFSNLLQNANKYGAKPYQIQVQKSASQVQISFIDQGKGVPPEQLEQLTKPFFQADATRSNQGSGLGLSLVSSIVKAHGGSLQFYNTQTGFCVRLALPIILDD